MSSGQRRESEPFGDEDIPISSYEGCYGAALTQAGTPGYDSLEDLLSGYTLLQTAIQLMEARHGEETLPSLEIAAKKTETELSELAHTVQSGEMQVMLKQKELHEREHNVFKASLHGVQEAEEAVGTARSAYQSALQKVVDLTNKHETEQNRVVALKGLVSILHQAHARETQLVKAIFEARPPTAASWVDGQTGGGELADATERKLCTECNMLAPQLAMAHAARSHHSKARHLLDIASYELAQARHEIVQAVGPERLGLPPTSPPRRPSPDRRVSGNNLLNMLFGSKPPSAPSSPVKSGSSTRAASNAGGLGTSPPVAGKEHHASLWSRLLGHGSESGSGHKGHGSPPSSGSAPAALPTAGATGRVVPTAAARVAAAQVAIETKHLLDLSKSSPPIPPDGSVVPPVADGAAAIDELGATSGGEDLLPHMDPASKELLTAALSKADMAVQNVMAACAELPTLMGCRDQATRLSLMVGHVALVHVSRGHLWQQPLLSLLARATELEAATKAAEAKVAAHLANELDPEVDKLQKEYTAKRAAQEVHRRQLIQAALKERSKHVGAEGQAATGIIMQRSGLADAAIAVATAAVAALNSTGVVN
mmetsp:Transcript_18131/g.45659  ORF Transcript_18131/g.45659 Transcript_18131/m.45659 type:complete len:598 (-) Transcript_18131:240-2033(-)|eukprot:CAMPEP_0202867732 /NCGR_PEP_ID=MMETSP1391-20130828/9590_1 /ASSEMBLY_ACC=CAM_ASM_000867 /TAXON_ID=1034604 /ORGANISM="Chlamydomonas leiostraca, Strain SAG 11-49" /LENGTH=597 /DNA_ID=CAMNT_0049547795 /DNA_START=55 /DNA_END=1848 /DNA_ORIENTATION=+